MGFEQHYEADAASGSFSRRWKLLMPRRKLCAEIVPFYPKASNGRPPVGLVRKFHHFA